MKFVFVQYVVCDILTSYLESTICYLKILFCYKVPTDEQKTSLVIEFMLSINILLCLSNLKQSKH